MTSNNVGIAPSNRSNVYRSNVAFRGEARLFGRVQTEVLTVMIIQHVVSPAVDGRADQVFAHIEIQRHDGVVRQQHALSLFEEQAAAVDRRVAARGTDGKLRTAADGSFEFADVLAGVWRLETRGAGYLPIRIEYFDDRGEHLKTLRLTDYAFHGPCWRAATRTMENHRTGRITRLDWSDFRFDTGLAPRRFTPDDLSRRGR